MFEVFGFRICRKRVMAKIKDGIRRAEVIQIHFFEVKKKKKEIRARKSSYIQP